jgi:hypothetical protein
VLCCCFGELRGQDAEDFGNHLDTIRAYLKIPAMAAAVMEGDEVVWQMQGQPVEPAGGYKLRYKSDWGHAYGNWDSLPPDQFFWGIVVYKK